MHECSSPPSGYKTTTCGIATWFQCTSLVSGRVRVHMLPALFTSVGKAVCSAYCLLSANNFKDPINSLSPQIWDSDDQSSARALCKLCRSYGAPHLRLIRSEG